MFWAIILILFFGLVVLSCIGSALPNEENAGCLAYIPFFIILFITISLIAFLF